MTEQVRRVLREIERQAQVGGIPIVGPVKRELLAEIVAKAKPKFAVEVGTAVGYSAIIISSAMDKSGLLLTFEQDPNWATRARANIEKAMLSERIMVREGNALMLLPIVKEPINFLFLDAAKEEYLDYLKAVEDRLRKGAIVVADNAKIFAAEMRNYLEYVRQGGKYRSAFHDLGSDGMEVSVKVD